jgi:hypothetical protein
MRDVSITLRHLGEKLRLQIKLFEESVSMDIGAEGLVANISVESVKVAQYVLSAFVRSAFSTV